MNLRVQRKLGVAETSTLEALLVTRKA